MTRELQPIDDDTSRSPFHYVGNILGNLREDQVPRFLGSLTHPDRLPLQSIPVSELTAVQNRVSTAGVKARADSGDELKPCVVCVFNGRKVIVDGHHAASAAWLRGDDQVQARVNDLEPQTNAMKVADKSAEHAQVMKVDFGLGIVFGWAIISTIKGEAYFDTQDDHIPADVMLESAAEFMENTRAAKVMHEGDDLPGGVVFAFPMTKDIAKSFGITSDREGLMIGMKPDDEDVLRKFASGEFTGFSIGGNAAAMEA